MRFNSLNIWTHKRGIRNVISDHEIKGCFIICLLMQSRRAVCAMTSSSSSRFLCNLCYHTGCQTPYRCYSTWNRRRACEGKGSKSGEKQDCSHRYVCMERRLCVSVHVQKALAFLRKKPQKNLHLHFCQCSDDLRQSFSKVEAVMDIKQLPSKKGRFVFHVLFKSLI